MRKETYLPILSIETNVAIRNCFRSSEGSKHIQEQIYETFCGLPRFLWQSRYEIVRLGGLLIEMIVASYRKYCLF